MCLVNPSDMHCQLYLTRSRKAAKTSERGTNTLSLRHMNALFRNYFNTLKRGAREHMIGVSVRKAINV